MAKDFNAAIKQGESCGQLVEDLAFYDALERSDNAAKLGIPPDKYETATHFVLRRAELLCKDWASA